jgi:hypothetical protein
MGDGVADQPGTDDGYFHALLLHFDVSSFS